MKLRKCGKIIEENDIIQIEEELEFELPKDYKAFLLRNNGGYVEGYLCTPVFEEVHPETCEHFKQSVNPDKFFSLEEVFEEHEENLDDPVFSEKLIPIGYDSVGNKILIGVGKDEDYGCIFFANHEWYVEKTGYFVTTKIADSFNEFVDCLHPYEG